MIIGMTEIIITKSPNKLMSPESWFQPGIYGPLDPLWFMDPWFQPRFGALVMPHYLNPFEHWQFFVGMVSIATPDFTSIPIC